MGHLLRLSAVPIPTRETTIMQKAIYIPLFAAFVAAAVAVPVESDIQTAEKWGAVGNAIGSAANKFSSWLKGKEYQLRNCPACETKTKRSWGRRRLLNAAETDEEWWKTSKYTDCSVRNKCLAENSSCQGKIDALKAAVAALDVEIAEAKKVAATHAATAAEKDKIKDLQAKEAAAAKKALDDKQTQIANLAKDLASEKKSQQTTKDNMASEVRRTADQIKKAKYEHAKKAHAEQLAEEKQANAAMAARVAAAEAKLKAAQAGLKPLADKHQKEAAEAAHAAKTAQAAHALKNVKNDVVKLHQNQRNATAKKIEAMQMH